MDLKVRENTNGEYLIIHANEFKEGVEYAAQIKIPQIQLRGVLGRENLGAIVDFKELEKLAGHLRGISFQDMMENIINLESIYSLQNLEVIYCVKQKFKIDISKFPKLQHLGSDYWKGLEFCQAYSLTSLVLLKLPDINLKRISELKNLKILHIYSSKIQTLEGIENLKNLEYLSLSRNNYLKSVCEIRNIKSLNRLSIEKCKNVTDYDFIKTMTNITQLYLDK